MVKSVLFGFVILAAFFDYITSSEIDACQSCKSNLDVFIRIIKTEKCYKLNSVSSKCNALGRHFRDTKRELHQQDTWNCSKIAMPSLADFTNSLCFGDDKCSQRVGSTLRGMKEGYDESKKSSADVCGALKLCSVNDYKSLPLADKFSHAFTSIMSDVAVMVEKHGKKWKRTVCQECQEHSRPFAEFFVKNQIELEEKIDKACSALAKAGIPKKACQNFLDGLVEKAKGDNFVCQFFCNDNTKSSSFNKNKVLQIESDEKERGEEISEKLSKVEESVQDTDETFSYLMSKESDVNAFCTLCITVSSNIERYQDRFVDTAADVVAELFFDPAIVKQMNVIQKLKESIGKSVGYFVKKYKNPEICRSEPIKACSSETYDRVKEAIEKENSKQLTCKSCDSFLSYVAPILAKSATKKDLANYLYKEITTIFGVQLLDDLDLDAYSVIYDAVNKVSGLISESGSCSNVGYCEAQSPESHD